METSDMTNGDSGGGEQDFKPREYQVEILEKALNENVIVYLPTGSGKTFIAGMVIKYLSKSLLKNYSEGGKRTFFLVNTVPLVSQQASSIRRQLPLEVGEYTGDLGVDYWDEKLWSKELEKNQVLVMTAQIFLDMLLHKYLELSRVNLLILDECHHAVNQHPMRQIMQQFENYTENLRPRVLGLTATLLNSNCKPDKVEEEIHNLEVTLQSKIVTALNNDMVKVFSARPAEEVIYYEENGNYQGVQFINECIAFLEGVIRRVKLYTDEDSNNKNKLKKILNNIRDIKETADDLGIFAGSMAALARIVLFERLKHSMPDANMINLLHIITTKLHLLRKKIHTILDEKDEYLQPIVFSSPKLRYLINLLRNQESKDLALIFVRKRITAKVLYYVFKELHKTNDCFSHINPDFIVGFNNNAFNDTRELLYTKKVNLAVLKKFNAKKTNVLFASDVIEEGIDVQLCNIVIKFDEPQTFRSYIQSKGRARNPQSKYILFVARNTSKFHSNYISFQLIEKSLKYKLCDGRADDRIGGSDIEAKLKLYDDEAPPYYANGDKFGPKVTVYSAISLINRYCASLPQDKFSILTPKWSLDVTIDGKYFVKLQLPINSSIKTPIIGEPCSSKLSAKRLVALKACEILHKAGEFNDRLLPVGSNSETMIDNNICPMWEEENGEEKKERSRIGSRKNRRVYDKHYSGWVCGCRPQPGVKLYLHTIMMIPNYNVPDSNRQLVFYNLIKSKRLFSILTTNEWPKICRFPLFMNTGEIIISLNVNAQVLVLTKEQISALVDFHSLLFTDVLSIVKKFVVRDYENMENAYLVVPTIQEENGRIDIDWDVVNNEKSMPKIEKVSLEERRGKEVDKEAYNGKIVVPWYRPSGNNMRYVVTRVCLNQSPESEFPSDQYQSYAQYFKQRYNQTIVHMNQPLIEVRAISNRLNCLLPRGKSRHGSSRKRKDEEDYEETLVPELCSLLTFPAVYMLKVTLLPSVLHKIDCLLNAEELRQKIAKETGVGVCELKGAEWEPLTIDEAVLDDQDDVDGPHSTVEISDMLDDSIQAISVDNYPWKEVDEPIDIERNLNVDLVSVIHYEKFLKMANKPELPRKSNRLLSTPNVEQCPQQMIEMLEKSPENSIGPQLSELLQVLTAKTANDIINYERLETLGDSFLKYAISLALFTYYNHVDEGKLSQAKGKIIGNRNLFYCGRHIKLGSLLKVYDFAPTDWNIPGFTVLRTIQSVIKDENIPSAVLCQIELSKEERNSGQLSPETHAKIFDILLNADESRENMQTHLSVIGQQSVSDKAVADSVEALIGVYLKSTGVNGALKILNWLGVLSNRLIDIDVLNRPPPTALLIPGINVDYYLISPDLLEQKLGYCFNDRSYLLQALSHSSYPHNVTDCYQRFEFLGDAILDFLITAHIYEKCGNLSPGDLTDLRSSLVNNVTFACLTVRYGFHKHMLAKACKLNEIMNRFIEHQENRNHAIGSEVLFLIEENDVKVAETVDVPKVLGDLFESLAAAVYLDSKKSLSTVWKVFYRLMATEINEFSKSVPRNHIRLLYEQFPNPLPKFGDVTLLDNHSGVLIPLEVTHNNIPKMFHGVGENKAQAKLAAAKIALRHYHTPKAKEEEEEICA